MSLIFEKICARVKCGEYLARARVANFTSWPQEVLFTTKTVTKC